MAHELHFLIARPADVDVLARNLRPEDQREVMASHGATPRQALQDSLEQASWACTVHDHKGPLCMFGVTDMGADKGCPWLLSTSRLFQEHRARFLRESRHVVERLRRRFSYLENHVMAENTVAVRWLEWLGFSIHPAVPWGFAGLPFHRFSWRG